MSDHHARVLDGESLAAAIERDIAAAIRIQSRHPGLAAILVGDNAASSLYVKLKEKAAQRLGIAFHSYISTVQPSIEAGIAQVRTLIEFLNNDPAVDAIILQLPLPSGYPTDELIALIDPAKDVDGFLPGVSEIIPPTIAAVGELLRATGEHLMDRRTLLIGNSDIFLRGLRNYLQDTFGIRDVVETHDIPADCAAYDTVVIALGRAHALTKQMVKADAIVIDVGINKLDGRTVGDVDPAVAEVAGYLSPVPGGVGPLTVACLMRNTYELAMKK